MNGAAIRSALVTGGAGFIGSHLVDGLVAMGTRVRVLDDLSTGNRANLREHLEPLSVIELVVGDVRDLEICRRACRDVELVFHLAAVGSVPRSLHDPAHTIDVNVGGTSNLFAAAREEGVRRVVYASSSSVYGDSELSPKREGFEGSPLSPYAASKRMNEALADVFARCFGFESVGLRFFNVFGPRQQPDGPYAAVIPRFFSALLTGRAATIFGDGGQRRDFTWVGDAVRAVLAAALAPAGACGSAYNVGCGRATSLLELERTVRELVGGGPEPRFAPARAGDVRHSLADTDAAAAALGFRAESTLRAGLESSLDYYRALCGDPAELAAAAPAALDATL
jgi:UDP-N-acetylglucosamine 4-epimerase